MERERKIILNIINSSSFKDIAKNSVIDTTKNNKLSEQFRKKANSVFNNQLHNSSSHEKIWKLYSKSVALAEANSEELALAFANRSAILLHMSKYKASLIDVDRALSISKNNCLQMKMLIRKVKCLHALGSDNTAKVLVEADLLLEKITVENLKNMFVNDINEIKFMIKKPFQQLEEANVTRKKRGALKILNSKHKVDDFSSVEVQYNKNSGRHLIALRDISPGEIIYIEKPYIHSVNVENTHLYCYHCLTTTWANLPCDQCTWAMFCSEKCKKEAWKQYHGVECSLSSSKNQSLDDQCSQLAVKALCCAVKEYNGIENLKDELAKFEKRKDAKKGFVKNGKTFTSGFKTMYILSNDVTESSMQKHKDSAALFLNTLLNSTQLSTQLLTQLSTENVQANNINEHKQNKNVIFLSTLFLRLSTVTEINKLDMWNGSYKCPNGSVLRFNCCRSECCSKGVYIAPISSLINHSCNPNVNVCYSDDHKAIVYALQPIKKGEQILRSYQDEFFSLERPIRRGLLKNIYNFDCKCVACWNNWPNLLLKQNMFPFEYERIIDSIFEGSANNNGKIISYLGRQLQIALEYYSHTVASIDLMRVLIIIFGQLYGIMSIMPSECNSEIKFV